MKTSPLQGAQLFIQLSHCIVNATVQSPLRSGEQLYLDMKPKNSKPEKRGKTFCHLSWFTLEQPAASNIYLVTVVHHG